jgi:CheY-like chemotaxis protein
MPLVFIVDDEELVLRSLHRLLSRAGISAFAFSEPEAALARREERPDLLICDYQLPRIDGLTLAREFKHSSPATRTMLLSGGVADEAVATALSDGTVDAFCGKPWLFDEMLTAVRGLLPPSP